MAKRRSKGEGSIEKLPSGSYRAIVSRMVNGRRVRTSKTFKRQSDAIAWRDKAKAEGPAATGTVGEWLTTWLELHKAKTSPSNFKTDRQTAERHLRPHLDTYRLRDLSALRIEQWLAMLKNNGISQSERHKAARTLRKCLNAAVLANQLPHSPMRGRVKVPRRPDADTHSLTAEEMTRVIRAAIEMGVEAQFRLWFDTGMRPAELIGLQWQDWNPQGFVHIRRAVCRVTGELKQTKTKRSKRILDVSPSTTAAMNAYRPADWQPERPIFPAARGGHWWGVNHAKELVQPVVERAGAKCTPYTVRHTCATLLLRAGIPLKVVSERLGHEDVATTLRCYAHVLEGDQARAAGAMELLLNPPPQNGPTGDR